MLNTFRLNTTRLNTLAVDFGSADQDEFVFNGYSLQSDDIISSIMLDDSAPLREFETRPVQRADGEFAVGDYWRQKTVRLSGFIQKTTNALLEAEIDLMKKACAVSESNLDIKKAGTIRRYVGTLINGQFMFQNRRGFHITTCPFELEFSCLIPFGQSVNYQSITFESQTSLDLDEQVENTGTTKALPIVVLNFGSASGVTAVSFTNNTTGESISITESVSAGDYLRFDSEMREVTINGTLVDYDGAFPDLSTGSNSITVAITGTSATYDLTVKAKNNYL